MEKNKVKVIVARPGEKAYVTEIVPDYKTLSALVGGHTDIFAEVLHMKDD